MTPERRKYLLGLSTLGRRVLDAAPATFADPAGAKGDLDPDGHWRTVSGNKIHITADGEIDAGGHPALRKILEEKAGLKVRDKTGQKAGAKVDSPPNTGNTSVAGGRAAGTPEGRNVSISPAVAKIIGEHGREVRGDGKPRFGRYLVGHGKREKVEKLDGAYPVGDVVIRKDGPWMVTAAEPMHFVSDDQIDDNDAWHEYPEGPGWYASYTVHPVNETPAETADRTAKESAAKAKADEAAAAKAKAKGIWSQVADHEQVYSLPPGTPLPEGGITWETVSDDLKWGGAAYHGTVHSIGQLADGTKIGKVVNTGYDDHREWYMVPAAIADRAKLDRAYQLGRTLEENRRLAGSTEYYKKEGQELLDAYERLSPEGQEQFRRISGSAARVHAAEPENQFAEAQRHRRETSYPIERTWLPDAARKEYDQRGYRFDNELGTKVPDPAVRDLVKKAPGFGAAREAATWGDDEPLKAFLAGTVPAATAMVKTARDAKRGEWQTWYGANEPALAAELGKKIPKDLIPAGLKWLKGEVESDNPPADGWMEVDGWGEKLKEHLLDNEVKGEHPELIEHGAKLRAAKAKKDEEEKIANREVRVTGNTYPVKDEIRKIPGSRFSKGSWYIPYRHVGKLPRKISYEDD